MSACKILITEDEMIVQMHLKRLVEGLGHEVSGTASTLKEALQAAERQTPDIVLMDIHLAEKSDGVEAAGLLRENYDCEIIFITAYGDARTVERTATVGASGYVVKPFSTASIRAAIQTALSNRDRHRQAKARELSLTSALEYRNDAVLVADANGVVLFASPSTAKFIGWPTHESCGRGVGEVLRLADRSVETDIVKIIDDVLRTGQSRNLLQLAFLTEDGSEVAVDVMMQPIREGEEPATGVLVALADRAADHTAAEAETHRPEGHEAAFGEGTRLLVYSHDTFGLGHLRRCHKLVRRLAADHSNLSVLLVTGSPMVHRFETPPGTDYLKLPAVRKVAPEQYEARSLSMSSSGIRSLRTNLLLHTVRDYSPNVVLVDHSPLGMRGEMLPALRRLKDQGNCQLILGLRDIIDNPDVLVAAWKKQGVYEVLRDIYDHIVIYGCSKVYDTVREYRFPDDVAAKTHYVNYVADTDTSSPEDVPTSTASNDTPLIVLSAGGGDGGATELIEPFLTMMQEAGPDVGFRSVILTGPFVEPDVKERLQSMADGLPAEVLDFVPSTDALFREADLVLSTCGYNTMTELIVHAKRSILIPRVLHREEQLIRAKRMEELGLARCIHPDEVTSTGLLDAIRTALRADPPLTRARAEGLIPVDGAEGFSKFCGILRIWSSVVNSESAAL